LVDGKRVTVEIYQVDRCQRLLSTMFIDGKDINLAMLEASLAEVYQGPESGNPYKPQYQVDEEAARTASEPASVNRNCIASRLSNACEPSGSSIPRDTHKHPHGCPP
jgi:endonuclease YncB( thermonuclease family)